MHRLWSWNQQEKAKDTVSKMLGHTNVRTIQIYAKVVDKKKEQAANAIKLQDPKKGDKKKSPDIPKE